MPYFNADDLNLAWGEPPAEKLQEFFDNLSEGYVRNEPLLIRGTTKEELDYIATWAAEARQPAQEQRALDEGDEGRGSKEDGEGRGGEEDAEYVLLVQAAPDLISFSPPSDSTVEAEFDLGSFSPKRKRKQVEEEYDTEKLAQRVAKTAKALTGDKPPAGGERQQEEPPRATPNTPPPSTTPPRGASPARASTTEPTHMEEEASLGAGGSAQATNAGREGATSSQPGADPSSTNREDIDTVIEEVVDEPSAGSGGSQEEQLLQAMSINFQKLQALHRARLDKAKSRMVAADKAGADLEERVAETQELILKQADVDKAQEAAKEQAAKGEAARHQHQALLNSQEENLAAREEALVATLRGKDEEALVHADKVKELELEREELKKVASELTKERDMANRSLADAQATVSDKAKLLSKANDSITDLKLKLDGLEGILSEAGAREETLNKVLEDEKQLWRNDVAEHEEYTKGVHLWINCLVDVAGRITTKLAAMGMPNVRYSQEPNVTLYFEGVLGALEQLRSTERPLWPTRPGSFAGAP
nr:plectin-like [Aegilops tauschii subsp. strangulata]